MLAKPFRLKKQEVATVMEEGNTKKTKLFIVRIRKSQNENNKFGTVISSKFNKKAVTRNKIKRRINEAIRINIKELEENSGINIVLIPKKICIEKEYQEIENDIKYILQNASLWVNI